MDRIDMALVVLGGCLAFFTTACVLRACWLGVYLYTQEERELARLEVERRA